MRRLAIQLSALAGLLVLAAPAAAIRYASPNGSPTDPTCAATHPCTLQRAIATSPSFGEVVLAQGDYHVASPQAIDCSSADYFSPTYDVGVAVPVGNLNVHGVPGRPRPRIIGSADTCTVLRVADAGTAAHLEVVGNDTTRSEATALLVDGAGSAYDMITSGPEPRTQMRNGGRVYNSVLRAGPDGVALVSHFGYDTGADNRTGSYIFNDTLLGTALAQSVYDSHVSISCENSIATGGFRIEDTNADGGGQLMKIALDHCAGATSSDGRANESFDTSAGGNIPAATLLPDLIHEAPTSPSIDAGRSDVMLNYLTDFDGGPRFAGTLPDIGADEFGSALPIVDSGGVLSTHRDTATVGGAVLPGGVPTAVYAEYGPTADYGTRTPPVDVSPADFANHAIVLTLPRMRVNGAWHYRLVATNGGVLGEDRTIVFPDHDHDGFTSNVDCNDANPRVHPGAREIRGNAIDEDCDGVAEDYKVPSAATGFTYRYVLVGTASRFTKLRLVQIPAHTKTTLTCKGGGCPFRKRTVHPRHGTADLLGLMHNRALSPGAVLEARISAPQSYTLVLRLPVQRGGVTDQRGCVRPGSRRVANCPAAGP